MNRQKVEFFSADCASLPNTKNQHLYTFPPSPFTYIDSLGFLLAHAELDLEQFRRQKVRSLPIASNLSHSLVVAAPLYNWTESR